MNKKSLCTLIILLFAGCRKKTVVHEGTKHDKHSTHERTSTYDEDIGAFVLDDDHEFNIFDEGKSGESSESPSHTDEIKWTEMDDVSQDEGHTVHFAYDSDRLSPEDIDKVHENVTLAKHAASDGAKVLIEGHSCLISHSEVYNAALSQRRAERVAKEYEKSGVPRKKMRVVGRGSSMATCQDEGKDAQGVNRRVETKFIYTD